METLVRTLKDNRCKITPQRLAVYHVLKDNKNHPNAEAIFKMLEPSYPTISLATVYKSLELFADLGLIQVINLGENSFRYDPNPQIHPHIICTKCNKVEDLSEDYFKDLVSTVASIANYTITKQHLSFYGLCPACNSH
ncbi:transcriptional regulator PerR [Alkaliphilus peptidifermentans]|uniref:Fur family transcriptional regulator, peroxide stress response regulator n=1 Tax=Alkaliphilus peptidifermentans DSM 18978 TaxID=1120976 RepID=A0A1G5K1R5_9FIRM|nr:Fur family transcriptional regulator [Alkaliphilus peptidifermentans]SCY94612.1 Fur family transcriptional regulator, peroxide stress response regulator [Alkaliphilus peptidifermentans DSM 18978]